MVSVLPSGIDVKETAAFTRFSVFRQTLSDINLDRSKVKSDKLLCVNTA